MKLHDLKDSIDNLLLKHPEYSTLELITVDNCGIWSFDGYFTPVYKYIVNTEYSSYFTTDVKKPIKIESELVLEVQ